jgi:hypothetical protein
MIGDKIFINEVEIFDLLGEICLFEIPSKPIINPKLSYVRSDARSDKIFIKHGRLFIGNEEVPICIQY